ncbi:MAG TPA: tetratricopeptide repeat protein [Candidatus Paceibacterota bacterium]|nr:hypothetical protein [Verrucomicrobiota bacterium]HOX03633.1 tetratricopeptide repeat protein [Verrucomicrobiota bacterium]HRZ46560.1 tetratricopeptide repeat protein [Candidatus Paceibacterota bacterium]HRZ91375.1 tetratricopeptide repeat protein [Candidatus Paceibacterota bacterium]
MRRCEEEAKAPAGPLEPRWGYDTCLTFIGRTCEQLGEGAKAADYYRKALARHPADHLAKEGLDYTFDLGPSILTLRSTVEAVKRMSTAT